jgi:hypothetical protein
MDIGNPLHRAALAFAGLTLAFAVILWVTPVGTAPANDRPAVYTGKPRAEAVKPAGRVNPSAKPVSAPKPAPKPARKPEAAKALPEVANSAGEPLDVSGACEENMALAAKRGLTLPDGWDIKCVGPGLDWQGNSHWGVACPYDSCPEGAGPYVSISNPNYYVIAHELCHANFGNDELMADSCAAEHGASLETSPYQ